MSKEITPFVKWVGGKRQLLPEIRSLYPDNFENRIKTYVEPFVGGGAVLFDVLNTFDVENIVINDFNDQLINAYKQVRDNCDALIDSLSRLKGQYQRRSPVEREAYFNKKRGVFNNALKRKEHSVRSAALFIFINKTCFNGLYRVNSKNEFNVPHGKYNNQEVFNPDNLRGISEKLRYSNIITGDYLGTKPYITDSTLVYFDPPYRPITKTASFRAYTASGFNDTNQRQLAEYARYVDSIGGLFILSNSDPKNSDETDTFFDDLYDGFTIKRVLAGRAINSDATKRGKITELLITNL